MNIWMSKKLGRLLCIFGLAILLVYATYKAGFKAITTSGIEGKTRVSDLPIIVTHSLWLFCCRILASFVIL